MNRRRAGMRGLCSCVPSARSTAANGTWAGDRVRAAISELTYNETSQLLCQAFAQCRAPAMPSPSAATALAESHALRIMHHQHAQDGVAFVLQIAKPNMQCCAEVQHEVYAPPPPAKASAAAAQPSAQGLAPGIQAAARRVSVNGVDQHPKCVPTAACQEKTRQDKRFHLSSQSH